MCDGFLVAWLGYRIQVFHVLVFHGVGQQKESGSYFIPYISHLLLLLSRFSRVRLCATPQMAAHQAPPSLGFSRQEHWSGLPFPSSIHESEK